MARLEFVVAEEFEFLYTLKYNHTDRMFVICNLNDDRPWSKTIGASNRGDYPNMTDAFLTKNDFSILLTLSGVKFDSIKIVKTSIINRLYNIVFDE